MRIILLLILLIGVSCTSEKTVNSSLVTKKITEMIASIEYKLQIELNTCNAAERPEGVLSDIILIGKPKHGFDNKTGTNESGYCFQLDDTLVKEISKVHSWLECNHCKSQDVRIIADKNVPESVIDRLISHYKNDPHIKFYEGCLNESTQEIGFVKRRRQIIKI